jgi:hypothetical protein
MVQISRLSTKSQAPGALPVTLFTTLFVEGDTTMNPFVETP